MRSVGLALLPAALLSGCTGAAEVGPLGGGGGAASLCTPIGGVEPVVFGNELLRNGGAGTVTVDSVRLVEANGLALKDAFLLPVNNKVLLGTRTVPPEAGTWSKRRRAAGATLAAREEANLALLLDRQPSGEFSDIEVRYTAGGERYNLRLASSLKVLSAGPCPAADER
jgi:hypothetical protein